MSKILPSTPRRGTLRGSHLRQVSNGSAASSSSNGNSRPISLASDTGTAHYDPILPKLPVEKRCNLWVHDETFAKEEAVLNLDMFPDVEAGDLVAIVALKAESGVRDFHEKVVPKKDADGLGSSMQRERSHSNPRSPILSNVSDIKNDVFPGKRYLFIARDMPKELKTKHPALELSVAKHIADVFSLKHRSNVLLTTVSYSRTPCFLIPNDIKPTLDGSLELFRLTCRIVF